MLLTRSGREWWKISVHRASLLCTKHQQPYGLDDQLIRKARVKENTKFDSERINRKRRKKPNAMWMHANNVRFGSKSSIGRRASSMCVWRRPQRMSANEMKTPLKQTWHGWFVCLIKYNVSSIRFRALLLAASQRDRVRLRLYILHCVLAAQAVIDFLQTVVVSLCHCVTRVTYERFTYSQLWIRQFASIMATDLDSIVTTILNEI